LDVLFPGALDAPDLLTIASRLGSDVPFFLSPSPLTLAWGRGERMLPLEPLPSAPVLLALPTVSVSTPEAFGALARERQCRTETSSRPRPSVLSVDDLASWEAVSRYAGNDFEPVVFRMYPGLATLREALNRTVPVLSLLSGSGSALFGVYGNEAAAEEARVSLTSDFPDTRFVLTSTEEDPRGS
jgi:4-diphosphocytidyl-2-C-methyl-D-erythritol kinase